MAHPSSVELAQRLAELAPPGLNRVFFTGGGSESVEWAAELVKDDDGTRFDAAERERLLREYLPLRLLQARLIARLDDRGDSVVQVAPPLICDKQQLDAMVDGLAEALADAGKHMGLMHSADPVRAA
jgi:adenosylmethionine-8-amino-7-oxononanoate aminotransferase